jgi:hypothetical protein
MKLIWWMSLGAVLSAIVLSVLLSVDFRLELWLGMLGPLIAALVSWIAMERQYLKRPAGMTSLMIKGFVAKMVFFAGYVTALLSIGLVQPVPFVVSFTAYFISLHAIEAIGLHRLQAANTTAESGAL